MRKEEGERWGKKREKGGERRERKVRKEEEKKGGERRERKVRKKRER